MARRRLALTLLLVLVAAAIGRCAVSDARTSAQVVRFWGLGREGEVVRDLVPEFERRHPGVRVVVQQIPWTAAHEKLLTACVGGSSPDLAQLGNTWIPEFAAIGAIEPLDTRIAASRALAPAAYFGGVWAGNEFDGATYGVPWYVDTRVLFYRPDLLRNAGFPEPPRTWSAWRAAMERVRAREGGSAYAMLLPTNEWEQLTILGLQRGATLLADGGTRGAFSAPPFAAAAEWYAALFRDRLAPVVSYTQLGNPYQEFDRGYFAMWMTGPWNLGEFRRRLPADRQSLWMTCPLPAPDGAPWPGVSFAGGSSIAIFRASKHKDAAWLLAEYLSEPDVQRKFYELSGDLPARRETWDAEPLAGDPRARAFRVQLTHVEPLPRVPEWEQIAQKLPEDLEAAIRGRQAVPAALAALDQDVDRILEKRRWILARAEARRGR
ncbi:MAG TPA: extracellular solute-binding protein [Thermoanaerobaculia bacterium]|jgi:multiple sugar transport system substrate-binding protein|nr:extracellular solute-binding protein [Thermoanaerobaculia bacterium]